MSFPKPETGLADWASKIKEMQRQVDADEEAEQKRLEDEIAASRLKRLSRRSQGLGGSRSNSLDLSKSNEFTSVIETSDEVPNDEPKTLADRVKGQADALSKLGGRSGLPAEEPSERLSPSFLPSSRAEPLSLAAFIGGRATGPRLNKHAPQQDAHDPTQFEQHSVTSIRNTSHPIFGRGGGGGGGGGVAMPGMTPSPRPQSSNTPPPKTTSTLPAERQSAAINESKTLNQVPRSVASERGIIAMPGMTPTRQTGTSSTPPPKIEPDPPSLSRNGPSSKVEGRSTPINIVNKAALKDVSSSNEVDAPVTSAPSSPSRIRTPVTTPPKSSTATFDPFTTKSYSDTPSPRSSSFVGGSPSSPPRKSPVVTPSLARAVQPVSKSSSYGPQIKVSASETPSPAFQKAPPPKDLTPSLSRLQGRGFVQSVVKNTSQFGTPPESPTGDRSRPGSGKKLSVFERWDQNSSPEPAAMNSNVSPKPIRKSWSADQASPAPTSPVKSHQLKTSPSANFVKRVPSPSMEEILPPAKLGSATTLMVVRPGSASPTKSKQEAPAANEFGQKMGESKNKGIPSVASSGTPLVHPTRNRAKRPHKPKGSVGTTDISPPATKEPMKSDEDDQSPKPSASPKPPSPLPFNDPVESQPNRVTDRWAAQSIIGVKSSTPSERPSVSPTPASKAAGRIALPGMIANIPASTSSSVEQPTTPGNKPTSDLGKGQPPRSPGSAQKHSRIPSTGNRATVMDVAQAMHESHASEDYFTGEDLQKESPKAEMLSPPTLSPPDPTPEPESPTISHLRVNVSQNSTAEKRKSRTSSFERYISLPPLQEETTSAVTPVGTLHRSNGLVFSEENQEAQPAPAAKTIAKAITKQLKDPQLNRVDPDLMNEPLPSFNVDQIVRSRLAEQSVDADSRTISVDLISISGNSTSNVTKDTHIFYDTEVLAVVRRYKSKSTGLVATTVWGWVGRRSFFEEREQRKLQELAKRYGANPIVVPQGSEPYDLVEHLGGQLAVRQGTRAHWTSENTSMHLARQRLKHVVIDELDLSINNLCSGFSYCLSILNTQYVWYGRGSTMLERQTALNYAKQLSNGVDSVIELREGESDEDETFWMMLGTDDYAKADYWRWKRDGKFEEPIMYSINANRGKTPITAVNVLDFSEQQDSVYVLDSGFELFILVGSLGRLNRRSIRLALSFANAISSKTSSNRPFKPTVHVLALPSQIPLDLKAAFRNLDETILNDNDIPDHMNVLSSKAALDLLATNSWESEAWASVVAL